jgi:hypothetical protein
MPPPLADLKFNRANITVDSVTLMHGRDYAVACYLGDRQPDTNVWTGPISERVYFRDGE